jgi:hypothetical protein
MLLGEATETTETEAAIATTSVAEGATEEGTGETGEGTITAVQDPTIGGAVPGEGVSPEEAGVVPESVEAGPTTGCPEGGTTTDDKCYGGLDVKLLLALWMM